MAETRVLGMVRNAGHAALIVGACVAGACAFGIVHDQITARVCVEYFTIGHPNILDEPSPSRADPTIQGLVWGVIATWWVGLIFGVPTAIICRAGPEPRLAMRDLVMPVGQLFGVMFAVSAMFGLLGYLLAVTHLVTLSRSLAVQVPPDRHARFLADGFAHTAVYGAAFLGGIATMWRLVNLRIKQVHANASSHAPPLT